MNDWVSKMVAWLKLGRVAGISSPNIGIQPITRYIAKVRIEFISGLKNHFSFRNGNSRLRNGA